MSDSRPWALGQRVRSEAEPSLGLGLVSAFPTPRSLEITFPAAGERRMYNPASAPLSRYVLAVGQKARSRDGRELRIERVECREDGLLVYHAQGFQLPETELADTSSAQDPLQRLMASELADPDAFALREAAWALRSEALQRRTRGLEGARVALLPHQLAIAHTIANREYPRALLADEVGLGKTIEACLIYSALRALDRADRVLILTPASLTHQWLVELYRRFNDLFAVVHAETGGETPFEDASRLIAPLDWLLEPERLEQALETPWDLVIVDEAHHLGWSRKAPSPAYRAVEALAARTQGLLLLTATPLRQGLETEFGLLRLVDPQRFSRFEAFEAEQAQRREVADLARRLAQGEAVEGELRKRFPDLSADGSTEEILSQLIDRHGTGRVLVRNRREKLGGFPGRHLHLSRLPLPDAWRRAKAFPEITALQRMRGLAETNGERPSEKDDPRPAWLLETIHALGDQKVLVMASSAQTVRWLETRFRKLSGLKVAVFHEELGLIERDRQAAYFADPEGAQVLLSSEIGGEGRNFQFCHHVLMFDLPLHPDALEQRIGRLDRIGQRETIQVHVPVIAETPSEALFRWHQSLGVFEAPLTGGEAMWAAQARDLLEVLEVSRPGRQDPVRLERFLDETRRLLAEHRDAVQASVDFLIDLNSYRQDLGKALASEIADAPKERLVETVSMLLEHFGVVEEDLADPRLRRIRPGDHMKVEAFPGLRPDGSLATYDRDLALAREEVQFLSAEHPLVEGALELMLDQSEGRASVALWTGAPESGVWVEFLFVLEAVGAARLALPRYLPPHALTIALDLDGQERSASSPTQASPTQTSPTQANLNQARLHDGATLWPRLAGRLEGDLPELLERAEAIANSRLHEIAQARLAEARMQLEGEQHRLQELSRLGTVSAFEVAAHAETVRETLQALAEARVQLDAVRVVVLTPEA